VPVEAGERQADFAREAHFRRGAACAIKVPASVPASKLRRLVGVIAFFPSGAHARSRDNVPLQCLLTHAANCSAWWAPPPWQKAGRNPTSLHHGGRSRRARHLRLRQPDQPDAEHRPHRARRGSPLQLLLHQFHLHAQPAAILTGQYSHKNGVYTLDDVLDPSAITSPRNCKAQVTRRR